MLDELSKKYGFILCIFVFILVNFLFLFRLGNEAIIDYDEGIYSQVIESTANSDNPILLSKYGPYFEKPPLYFWSAIAINKIFESPELAYRLPSAIAGIVAVLLVMLIIYGLTGNLFLAGLGGLVLTTTPTFLEAGRQVRLDVPVTTGILFGVYSFIMARRKPIWYLGIGVGIAIGFMTKLVVGLFVFGFIAIWSLVNWKFDWLKSIYFWLGMILMILLIAPWHIYEWQHFGLVFWDQYLLQNVFGRFGSNTVGYGSDNSSYFSFLFKFSFPWFIVFLFSLWSLYKNRKDELAKQFISPSLFGLAILFIFNTSKTQLFYYIVPMLPFMTIGIVYLLKDYYERFGIKVTSLLISLLLIMGLTNSIYIGFHFQENFKNNQIIAKDEKALAMFLLENPEPKEVYAYEYLYWDTIKYYSKGRDISLMTEDQLLDKPFYLIMSTSFRQNSEFPPDLEQYFTEVYQGEVVTLLQFKP